MLTPSWSKPGRPAPTRTLALLVALLVATAAACGGSALRATGDVADVADTAAPQDTLAPDAAEPDTAAADTAEPEDTANTAADTLDLDTAAPDDTAEPEDTALTDTVVPDDAAVADTAAPEDTAATEDTALTDAGPPPCADDDACAAFPVGPCATPRCDLQTGACIAAPAHEGSTCEDGNLCTTAERCVAGTCVATAPVVCSDPNPCTDDSCEPALGCRFKNNLAGCDDGDPCTSGDRCGGGVCHAGGPACDDANPCTSDSCDPDGACFNVPDDALACSDGSACTGGDFCAAGVCVAGPVDGCDDHNACTTDACSPDGHACTHANAVNAPCDDGDACTSADRCVNGACVSGGATACGGSPGCVDWTCDAATGCALVALHVGATCTDNDKCTTGDLCDASGSCVASGTTDCDDHNPCTLDACVAATGCTHQITGGACDDTNTCTTDDKCVVGQCKGTVRSCNDGDACTLDTCDPLIGCEFVPGGVDCDDHNPCTDDSCHPQLGCLHSPNHAPCDDGLRCSVADRCDSAGACVGTLDQCDDDDACTIDFCDPEEGCHHAPLFGPCQDGDACTTGEQCDIMGVCEGGTSLDPDDGVPCTLDSCSAELGVVHLPDPSQCALGEACSPTLGCTVVAPVVLITRLLLEPGVSDTEPGFGQWLVLTNVTDAALDLAGFSLDNAAGDSALLVTPGGDDAPVLAAGASVAAVKATLTAPPDGLGSFALVFGEPEDAFAFDPTGDRLTLRDAEGVPIDVLDVAAVAVDGPVADGAFPLLAGVPLAFDADRLAAATTATANDDPSAWCAAAAPPTALAPVACGRARLNEVRLGGPAGGRWIELHLPPGGLATGHTVRLVDATGAVLATRAVTGRMPIGAALLLRDAAGGITLPGTAAGAVQLLRGAVLVDVYGFGVLATPVDDVDGLPLFEGTPGATQGDAAVAWRAADGVDSDDNGADWVTGLGGSPGALNAP